MDLLFWNQKKADLTLRHTTNLYLNKYVYRLVVEIPPRLTPEHKQFYQNIIYIQETIPDIKLRVSHQTIQIYSNLEDQLKGMVNTYPLSLVSLSYPASDNAEIALLAGGYVIQSTQFKYKLHVPAQKVPPEIKESILSYLQNQHGVKITEALRDALIGELPNTSLKHSSIWRTVIYSNDDSVALYLTLLCPGFINKIQNIHQP